MIGRISNREIYIELLKMQGQFAAIKERNVGADAIHADMENRMRAIEKWKYMIGANSILAIGSIGVVLVRLATAGHG